jgi:hypothetical protein
VAIYDANNGFVTGGGWINSPAGAYVANPALTGKANFGFVSKYQKGATVPTGNTEFDFKAGNLNFHSTSYEWLTIAGARARDQDAPGGTGLERERVLPGDVDAQPARPVCDELPVDRLTPRSVQRHPSVRSVRDGDVHVRREARIERTQPVDRLADPVGAQAQARLGRAAGDLEALCARHPRRDSGGKARRENDLRASRRHVRRSPL